MKQDQTLHDASAFYPLTGKTQNMHNVSTIKQYTLYQVTDTLLAKSGAIADEHGDQGQPLNEEALKKHEIKEPDCIAFYQARRLSRQKLVPLEDGSGDLTHMFISVVFEKGVKEELQKRLFYNGFSICFEDNATVKFCRFEMSSNMARNGRIMYIAETLLGAVENAITLGWEPKPSIAVSKWMAYKGLALSSGEAAFEGGVTIESLGPGGKSIEIKKPEDIIDYIIVVKDLKEDMESVEVFDDSHPDGGSAKQKINNINRFDGAGLISWDLAEKLGEETSFQFRMPFCKGMLHKVRFHSFFRDVLKCDRIKDTFGQEHDLSKVLIILTESQFKALQWFPMDGNKRQISYDGIKKDIWNHYRNRFRAYKHRLFISQRAKPDSKYGDSIPLNYQLISTLELEPNDEQALLEPSVKRYLQLNHDYRARLIEFTHPVVEDPDYSPDDPAAPLEKPDHDNSEVSSSVSDILAAGMRKNARFVLDTHAKTIMKNAASDQLDDIAVGRLIVRGKTRYLTPDLLRLLIHIGEKSSHLSEDRIDLLRKLKRKCLDAGNVYIPCFEPERFSPDRESSQNYPFIVAIGRNPHISRNEHIIAKTSQTEIYKRLFDHLDRVCMLNSKDVFAERLGGADFDGDLVKITDEHAFIKGVGQVSFEVATNQYKIFSGYSVKINPPPLVAIGSSNKGTPARKLLEASSEWTTFKNSKDNNIGILSNLAVFFAQSAYSAFPSADEHERLDHQRYLQMLTGYIGQEIDKVKTGVEPQLDKDKEFYAHYKGYRNNNEKPKFLRIKDRIKKQEQQGRRNYKKSSDIPKRSVAASPFLDRLRSDAENMAKAMHAGLGAPKMPRAFKLKDELVYTPYCEVTDEERKRLYALYFAYTAVKSELHYDELEDAQEADDPYEKSNHYFALRTILHRQFGDIDSDTADVDADKLIKSSVEALQKCIGLAGCEALVDVQRNELWAFTPKENRRDKLKVSILGSASSTSHNYTDFEALQKFEDSADNTQGFRLDEFINFVTDFSFRGYDSLSYLFKTARFTHINNQVNKAKSQEALEDAISKLNEELGSSYNDEDGSYIGTAEIKDLIRKKQMALDELIKRKKLCFGTQCAAYDDIIEMYYRDFQNKAKDSYSVDILCRTWADAIFIGGNNTDEHKRRIKLVNAILTGNIVKYDVSRKFFWNVAGNAVRNEDLYIRYNGYSLPEPIAPTANCAGAYEYLFKKYKIDKNDLG